MLRGSQSDVVLSVMGIRTGSFDSRMKFFLDNYKTSMKLRIQNPSIVSWQDIATKLMSALDR